MEGSDQSLPTTVLVTRVGYPRSAGCQEYHGAMWRGLDRMVQLAEDSEHVVG